MNSLALFAFPGTLTNLNLSRFLFLAEKIDSSFFNYGKRDNKFYKLIRSSTCFLVSPSISFIDLILIFFFSSSNSSLILWSLELYDLSFIALVSEFSRNYIIFCTPITSPLSFTIKCLRLLFNFFGRLLKLFLLLVLTKLRHSFLISSSNLRRNYLSSSPLLSFVFDNQFVLYNSPICIHPASIPEDIRIPSYPYFYISGSINDYTSFTALCYSLVSSHTHIVVSCLPSEELYKLEKKFFPFLILTGYISSTSVASFMRRSLGLVVLYDYSSLNQIFSASSKLLEAMSINKPVIISNNPGALDTLRELNYSNFYFVDDLTQGNIPYPLSCSSDFDTSQILFPLLTSQVILSIKQLLLSRHCD